MKLVPDPGAKTGSDILPPLITLINGKHVALCSEHYTLRAAIRIKLLILLPALNTTNRYVRLLREIAYYFYHSECPPDHSFASEETKNKLAKSSWICYV